MALALLAAGFVVSGCSSIPSVATSAPAVGTAAAATTTGTEGGLVTAMQWTSEYGGAPNPSLLLTQSEVVTTGRTTASDRW